ncbi:hypothetical protein NQ315_012063 [Exocentrus adspersus]|uniref:Uncharacterized protein n=1 Tax=Exocentrus adspersus TaxID=1586481 RepID=A0AAV8VYI7_9CUCU|nr:hypothetical protein NQ315_012063 [Exocentrus adspersus]
MVIRGPVREEGHVRKPMSVASPKFFQVKIFLAILHILRFA